MSEKFCTEVLTALDGKINDATLSIVMRELTKVLTKYDVTERCTDVIVYEVIPKCVKDYLVVRKIEGLSMKSLELYGLRLKQFFEVIRKPIQEVTAVDVRMFLYWMQDTKHCSERTTDGIRSIIATFFKWANAEGYIDKDPCVTIRPIRYKTKETDFLTDEELERLRQACTNIRDSAMVEFFFSTGCRVSELLRAKKTDVNWITDEVTLFCKGAKEHKSYLDARAKIMLQAYLDSRDDKSEYLFVSTRSPHGQLTKSAIERIIELLGKAANINRKVYPHLIRHTTATLALRRGMDITEVQKLLGHVNISTTLIYAKVADEAVQRSHSKYII